MVVETLVSHNATRVATVYTNALNRRREAIFVNLCTLLLRLFVRQDPRPRPAGPGATPPQPGGGLLERICPVGPLPIVPRRLAGGCVPRLPGGNVTEKRSLRNVGAADCAFP